MTGISDKENIGTLIVKYLDGDITDAEMDEFNAWVNENEAHREEFREVRDMHLLLKDAFCEDDGTWKNFSSKLRKKHRNHEVKMIARYVAAVVVGIGLTFSLLALCRQEPAERNFTVTTQGLPTTVTLGDGTFVKLGAHSSLTYTSAFNSSNRDVTLRGEGFFAVAKNEEMPFIVNARKNVITVTGTKFNVNARNENQLNATLLEGGISFLNTNTGAEAILTPGRTLNYNEANAQIKLAVSHATVDDFMSDNHEFYSETLVAILDRMSNVYGVKFICNDEENLKREYRTIFNNGEDLQSFLEVINSLTDLKAQRKDKYTVVLYREDQ